ncbi:MAG: phospho-sugar mutase [Oscillospiraceae bacterium]|nr:MAG: phospho-sugar mutase [Oscillospiraceae bacterium]
MDYKREYERWVENVTPQQKQELLSLSEQEKKERFYTDLEFGTAGMRGILRLGSNGMNEYTVGRATLGLAGYVCACKKQREGVAISYDSRHRSREFACLAARILAYHGVHSYLCSELRPVPLLSFAVRHYHAFAGIMITASHNPKEYNGYKVYGQDGAQLSLEPAADMLSRIEKESYFGIKSMDFDTAVSRGLIQLVGEDLDDAYFEAVLPLIDKKTIAACRDIKIVYTPIHGSGCKPVCRAFKELGLTGVQLLEAQAQPDGDFSTVKSPNPENIEALSMAIDYAEKTGARLVVGTDPDCDRVGVAVRDKNGDYVPLTGNQLGCVLLEGLLRAQKEAGTLPKNGVFIKP